MCLGEVQVQFSVGLQACEVEQAGRVGEEHAGRYGGPGGVANQGCGGLAVWLVSVQSLWQLFGDREVPSRRWIRSGPAAEAWSVSAARARMHLLKKRGYQRREARQQR